MQNVPAGISSVKFEKAGKRQSWAIDYTNSSVVFSLKRRNLIAAVTRPVEGRFKAYTGFIHTNGDDFIGADISFTVLAHTIDTGNPRRDNLLRSERFLHSQLYPTIQFHGVSFEKSKERQYTVEGNCVIHGIVRRTVFDILYDGTSEDESGRMVAVFTASGKIRRRDFRLRINLLGEMFVENEVTVVLKLRFVELEGRICSYQNC